MIPNNVAVVERSGNMGGEQVKMRISEAGVPYLMNLLTDLYSNPALACLREYSTNAWDSHIDAGNTSRPIEVTLPSNFSPYLTIRDFGVGMDADTIRAIYSQYGESTKREQKTTNGSMGIGAKAALGYTNQFTVAGIKNGVKTLVSVSRDSDGSGIMEIVYTGVTDEDNGVTIQIPAIRNSDFDRLASNFFRFWKKGTVLVNGEDPTTTVEMITPRIGVLPDGDEDLIVMGNVPYPVDYAHKWSLGDKASVAFVTMNGDDEVVFTPSREGLIYNSTTKKAIAGIKDEYEAHIKDYLTKTLNDPSLSYVEAFRKHKDMVKNYGASFMAKVAYSGPSLANFTLSKDVAKNGSVVKESFRVIKWYTNRNRNAVDSGSVYFETVADDNNSVIVNYPGDSVPSTAKARLKAYFAAKGNPLTGRGYWNSPTVILVRDDRLPNADCTGGIKTYDWKEILKETRAARTSTAGSYKSDGTFEAMIDGTMDYSYEVSEYDDVVYWSSSANWDWYGPSYGEKAEASKAFPDVVFIEAGANRHNRLARIAGTAKRWDTFWNEAAKKFAAIDFDKLTADDFQTYAYHEAYDRYNKEYSFGLSTYCDVSTYLSGYKKVLDTIDDKEYTEVLEHMFKPVPDVGRAMGDPRWKSAVPKVKVIRFVKDRYPLINRSNVENVKECIEYMNYKHAQRMESN